MLMPDMMQCIHKHSNWNSYRMYSWMTMEKSLICYIEVTERYALCSIRIPNSLLYFILLVWCWLDRDNTKLIRLLRVNICVHNGWSAFFSCSLQFFQLGFGLMIHTENGFFTRCEHFSCLWHTTTPFAIVDCFIFRVCFSRSSFSFCIIRQASSHWNFLFSFAFRI